MLKWHPAVLDEVVATEVALEAETAEVDPEAEVVDSLVAATVMKGGAMVMEDEVEVMDFVEVIVEVVHRYTR